MSFLFIGLWLVQVVAFWLSITGLFTAALLLLRAAVT